MRSPRFGFLTLLLFLMGSFPLSLKAQDYSLQIGSPTFTTAQPVELGFLNVANGNLHIEVPIGLFSQRGGRPFTASLVYDSRIWKISGNAWHPTNVANSNGGWRYIDTGTTGSAGPTKTQTFTRGNPPVCSYMVISNFQWTAPDGTQRMFPISTTQETPGDDGCPDRPSTSGPANDSSGFYMSVSNYTQATVYAPDGTQVYPNVKDTNGNYFSGSAGNVTDTLGRQPVTTTTNCNGNSSQTCYNVLNSQGNRSTITVATETISVSTNFLVSGVTEYSGSLTVIQSVKLPDNNTYQFGYDSYGGLSSITLPKGGTITYGYNNFRDSFGNTNRWATSRTPGGGGTWSYNPTIITTCGSGQVGCQQKVTVTKPSNDTAVYTFTLNNGAWVAQVQTYTGQLPLLSTLTNTWNFSNACSPTPCTGNSNIQKVTQTLTLPTPSGSVTNATQFIYDSINDMNVTSIKEWSFYSGTQPATPNRETDITYLTNYGQITNRPSSVTICVPVGTPPTCTGSTNILSQTNYTYDDAGTLFNSTPATGIFQHDDTNYGLSNTIRGNLTSIKRCTNLSACSSNYIQTTKTYDTTGQALSVKDPKGNTTNFSYADKFYTDVGDGPSHPPQTYSSAATTNALVTSVTPPLLPAKTFGYYYGTGQRAFETDANGQTTYFHFFDSPFSRPTSRVLPDGGWNYTAYAGSETQIDTFTGITGSFATSGCTGCRQDETLLDNLGRVTTQKLMSDPEGIDIVATSYDTTGRAKNTSHPYRTTSDPTYGLETPTYDGLNRVVQLTHQDNTSTQTLFGAAVSGSGVNTTQLCSSSTYGLGFPTLAIDEAGKKREIWVDGFGHTIEGDEPDSSGNLTSNTCYLHDLLGNLLQIVHGSQTRTHVYDALARVTSTTIPERANSSGTNCAVTYTYDNNGNVLTRNAPAPNQNASCTTTVTTCFGTWSGTSCDGAGYDSLNRIKKISYSDGTTPPVQYGYDGNALSGCTTAPPTLADVNKFGRMTVMCDSSGATSWSHDSMGRILTEKRIIQGSPALTTSYSYNLDSSIATVTFPSGKTVTYTVSNAQRLTAAKDTANSVQFVTAASYSAPGGLSAVITGQISGGFGGITESHTYNSSLEYTGTKATSSAGTAMDLTLNYALTGGDNGTVTSITNNADTGRTQTLGYDSLNRISSATSQATSGTDCWGQNFGPDALANLNTITSAQCSSNSLSVSVDGNNHITTSGFGYDAAGNMLQDGSGTGYSYSFDAENRLVKATGMSGGPYCYVYDGSSLRVAKKSGANSDCTGGTVTKLYWRLLSGDALAETDGSGSTTNAAYAEYVFFAGRRIASRVGPSNGNTSIYYYFADQLGSVRTITTGSGSGQTPGQLCYDADFTPYGQEISYTARLQTTGCPPNYKFTGYERDPETGLDYAFARYYSSRLGRFLSTDLLGGSIGNLQSHNAYAYALNSPLNFADPTGLDPDCADTKFGANGQFCPTNAGPQGDLGCTLDGVAFSCSALGQISQSLAGVSSPLPSANGTLMLWLSGGSITTINAAWGMQTTIDTSYFSGEWITLPQFIGMVKSYEAGLGYLNDEQRIRFVARGVVQGAGAIGDWRFIVSFYGLSVAGGYALAETAVLASGPEADSVFGTRIIYGENALQTDLYHASTSLLDSTIITEGEATAGSGAYLQYSLPGFINGVAGTFQVGGYWLSPGIFYVVHHFFQD